MSPRTRATEPRLRVRGWPKEVRDHGLRLAINCGPYGRAALQYLSAGWDSPLPTLKPRRKFPVPTGYTGVNGQVPTDEQIDRWSASILGRCNILLHLPDDVIGLDVDGYDGKPGAATLAALEKQLGPLPATWCSTSRDDGMSGIRFFRVPRGLKWPGEAGPGVEIVQQRHRYAMVWPSIHPEGRMYRWHAPDGTADVVIPEPDELTVLPDTWVARLTGGQMSGDPIAGADVDATAWIAEHGAGQPCALVVGVADKAIADLGQTETGSRHNRTGRAVYALVSAAAEGHHGVAAELDRVRDAFYHSVQSDQARSAVARAEWKRSVAGAVVKVVAEQRAPVGGDPCRVVYSVDGGGWFSLVRARELAEPQDAIKFLIKGVWPVGSHGPLGAEKKALKTYATQALAVATAAGKDLFNNDHWTLDTAGPVLNLVGEGGQTPWARRLVRVASAYGVARSELADLPIYAVFGVAPVDSPSFTDAIKRALDELQPVLVTMDPLYAYHAARVESSNLYERGRMLAELSETIGHDAAFVVNDHFKKTGNGALDLDSISQAGMAQWADSWWLQAHDGAPDVEQGRFRLDVEFGSRQWGGRRWRVEWSIGAFDFDAGQHVGDVSWVVTAADYADAGGRGRTGGRAKITSRIVETLREHPYEFTKTQLIKAVPGRDTDVADEIENLLEQNLIHAVPTKQREANRDVERLRYGVNPDPKIYVRPGGN